MLFPSCHPKLLSNMPLLFCLSVRGSSMTPVPSACHRVAPKVPQGRDQAPRQAGSTQSPPGLVAGPPASTQPRRAPIKGQGVQVLQTASGSRVSAPVQSSSFSLSCRDGDSAGEQGLQPPVHMPRHPQHLPST